MDSCALCAEARSAKDFGQATLVEAAQYIPCQDACFALDSLASAFCFRVGDDFLVGEQKGYLHELRSASTDDLPGKEAQVKAGSHFISVHMADYPSMKLTRGSLFEGFKENGCIAEVHKPILAHANSSRRSPKIPDDAIAIAGSGRGDFQSLYLWFECIPESDSGTIGCGRWYGNGDSDGKDWYCARTVDGKPVWEQLRDRSTAESSGATGADFGRRTAARQSGAYQRQARPARRGLPVAQVFTE